MLQDTKFEVNTEKFSGPLDKLLELTQEKKIDINEVGLAKVTQDFIDYLESIEEDIHPLILTDFISVASRLLLIKSRSILPNLEISQEEEQDIKELELRLQIYKEFAGKRSPAPNGAGEKSASQYVEKLWLSGKRAYGRKLLQGISAQGFFYPPEAISAYDLEASMRNLFTQLEELIEPKAKIKIKVVTLQEKMTELKDRLEQAINHDFHTLSQNRPKQEVIVLFLAVLHLFAHKALDLEQSEKFGNIKIRKI